MARKSRELRLTQTQELIKAYEAAGLGEDRSCRFARDMEWRLNTNRGLSPKRRAWLDSIIESGVPAPKNEVRVNEIMAAADLKGMERHRDILVDFAGKVRRGWDLSPKQVTWLDNMLTEANEIRTNGIWTPDAGLAAKMVIAARIGKAKDGWYWNHRPGTSKAHGKVTSWLADPGNNQIDEWACNKLLDAYKKYFRELDVPRHEVGGMRYFRGEVGIISGAPFVNDGGSLVYPMLVSGMLTDVAADSIGKRRQKRA
jgi:hypothetical protein